MLLSALVLLTLLVVAIIVRDLWGASRVPLLTPRIDPSPNPPSFTVIIPARNEAARIRRCLEGLVAQELKQLDVIVLDDNSTDATADVVRSFASRLPGLRLLQGEPLPPGWSGKCWACWQAANCTDAEWLLFLDADTAPQPAMIQTLLSYAITQRLDLLTLLPLLELESFWERVLLPPFAGIIQAVMPLDLVNDPRSSVAFAAGPCILIRRSVYIAVDGHRAIRDSVLEDVRLGQIVKGAGYRLRAVAGPDLMRVRLYTSLTEISEGLRKNAFAGTRAAGNWRTAWAGLRQGLLACAPAGLVVAGLVLSMRGDARATLILLFGLLLGMITLAYWGYVVHRLNRLNPLWALAYPLGTLSYFSLAGLAFLSILFGRGVTWKDRTYRG